jgi:Rieske Fe-S protein
MGMTNGTIAGMLLTDMIMGRENPWAELYDPSRVPLGAFGTFLRENLNVARQYGDWLTSGDVPDVDAIRPGSGAIIRRGLKNVAFFSDEIGALKFFSAVCPNLGCVVSWNDAARSWDCPCHGSRFDCKGQVIVGPANQDLRAIE